MLMMRLLISIMAFCLLIPIAIAQESELSAENINSVRAQLLEDVPVVGQDRDMAVLSPDGTQLVRADYEDTRQLCLHTLQTGEIQCVALPDSFIWFDTNSVRWSPDQHYVVFTDDSWQLSYDGDIWLLDTEQLTITNITEDAVSDRINVNTDILPEFFLDIAPDFAPDGRLMFIRYRYIPDQRTYAPADLMAFTIETNTLEALFTFPNTGGTEYPAVWHMTLSPDGESIAWMNGHVIIGDGLDAESGIYLTDTQTFSTPQQLANYQDYELLPLGLEFSPDSRYLLTLASVPRASVFEIANSSARILDTETGETILISEDFAVHQAGWLPTGNGLIYIVLDGTNAETSGIYISNAVGETGRMLRFDNTDDNEIDLIHLGRVRDIQERGFPRRAIAWQANQSLLLHPSLDNLLLVTYGE